MAGQTMYQGLRIRETQYNTDDKLSVKSIYNHPDLIDPVKLDNTMTWLVGNHLKNGTLQMMTIGAALNGVGETVNEVEVNGTQYYWDVMGDIIRNDVTVRTDYVAGEQPGYGNSTFIMYMRSNWLKKGWVIVSGGNYQVRVLDYEQIHETMWRYVVQPVNLGANEFVPLAELLPGVMWTDLFAPVSEIDSKAPGYGRRVLPGKATNAVTTIRHSYAWKGNVANRKTNFLIDIPNGSGFDNYLMAYDAYMFEQDWLMQKETMIMYGEYNVLADGTTSLTDPESGEYIKIGAGLIQQIANRDQYTTLTYAKLKQLMYDVYYGREETHGMKITLMTGLGGMNEIDEALKDYLTNVQWSQERNRVLEERGKDSDGLTQYALNGFINKVYFIGGFTLEVLYHPIFDYGKMARVSPKHPVTGFPMESYKMIFLDTNGYEGSPNLQYVYERGMRMVQKVQPGMNAGIEQLGFRNYGDLTVTEKNESAVHRMGTCGVVLRRPLLSLMVENILS